MHHFFKEGQYTTLWLVVFVSKFVFVVAEFIDVILQLISDKETLHIIYFLCRRYKLFFART